MWFDVLTGGALTATADFATFARLTVEAAERRYAAGSARATAMRWAWEEVGVLVAGASSSGPTDATGAGAASPQGPATQVQVRRTGGLAGQRRARTVALDELPDEDAEGWRALLADHRLQELATGAPTRPVPDAFTYHVACPPDGEEVTLPEHGIPERVRDLFQRTLGT